MPSRLLERLLLSTSTINRWVCLFCFVQSALILRSTNQNQLLQISLAGSERLFLIFSSQKSYQELIYISVIKISVITTYSSLVVESDFVSTLDFVTSKKKLVCLQIRAVISISTPLEASTYTVCQFYFFINLNLYFCNIYTRYFLKFLYTFSNIHFINTFYQYIIIIFHFYINEISKFFIRCLQHIYEMSIIYIKVPLCH